MSETTTIDDAIRYFETLHRNIRRHGVEPPSEEVLALKVLKEKKKQMEGLNEQTTL